MELKALAFKTLISSHFFLIFKNYYICVLPLLPNWASLSQVLYTLCVLGLHLLIKLNYLSNIYIYIYIHLLPNIQCLYVALELERQD
jgi:hypothetical protein